MLKSLAKKPTLAENKSKGAVDPFMPPFLPGLFISDLSPTHRLLFNKFSVCKEHSLVVSKEFERQDTPLNKEDWLAVALTIQSLKAFMFFNRGFKSGMSVLHKHIQVIPFESMTDGTLPVE